MQRLPPVLQSEVMTFVRGDRKYWRHKFRNVVKLLCWAAKKGDNPFLMIKRSGESGLVDWGWWCFRCGMVVYWPMRFDMMPPCDTCKQKPMHTRICHETHELVPSNTHDSVHEIVRDDDLSKWMERATYESFILARAMD